jgi:acyl-CoA thioester hydrolase
MFYWPVRVYYEDTDSGGVVYYANFLRFMERARTEWLRSFGVEQDELRATHGIIFAVRSVSLEFLRPGRFNDLLQVGVALTEARAATLRFSQQVLRAARGADPDAGPGELLCAGEVQVACLDAASFRPRRLPDFLTLEIERDV